MTNKTTTATIRQMAIRPQLRIDVDPQLNFALDGLASQESVKQSKKVTKRELVLTALATAHPELKPLILAELGRND